MGLACKIQSQTEKSCFSSEDSRSCDLLINQPPLDLIVTVHTLHGIPYGDLNESQR